MYATDILDLNDDISMTLPRRCSIREKHLDCLLPPSYIISVTYDEKEYMIAVVCKDHRDQMEMVKSFAATKKNPTR
jgi:hypothetical protein